MLDRGQQKSSGIDPPCIPQLIIEATLDVRLLPRKGCQAAPLKNKVKNGFSSDISLLHFLDNPDDKGVSCGFDARSSELRF
jgi:hypothetical protein